MSGKLRNLWISHKLLTVSFVAALLFTGFFAFKTAANLIYWSYHRDEDIQNWMTVRYIANSYNVDAAEIGQAIGLIPGEHDRRAIGIIARDTDASVTSLQMKILQAIQADRARLSTATPVESNEQP